MSMIGGIIDTLFSIGEAYENKKLAKGYQKIAGKDKDYQLTAGKDLLDWGNKDYARYQTDYQPVGEGLAREAAKGPNYNKVEGQVSADVAQQGKQANAALVSDASQRHVNPASGNFRANVTDVAGAQGRVEGTGFGLARRGEDAAVFNRRMQVINDNRSIPQQSSQMLARGMDITSLSARRAAGLADEYGSAAQDSLYGAGKSAAKAMPKKEEEQNDNYNNYNLNTGNGDFGGADVGGEGSSPYKDGGLIRGPGTGRSDSIPAKIDGVAPARVSNGERMIPAAVVAHYGRAFFDKLRDIGMNVQDAHIVGESRHGYQ